MGYTTIETPEGNYTCTTQAYIVGTYIVITKEGRMISQSGTTRSEADYHKNLRKKADKNGDKWTGTNIKEMQAADPEKVYKEPIKIRTNNRIIETKGKKAFSWKGLDFYYTFTPDNILGFKNLISITEASSGMSAYNGAPDEEFAKEIALQKLNEYGEILVKEEVKKHIIK